MIEFCRGLAELYFSGVRIGIVQKADKYLIPLGRIPDFVRYRVKQLDLRPGIYYLCNTFIHFELT